MSQFRASHAIIEWINGGPGAKRTSHALVEWIESAPLVSARIYTHNTASSDPIALRDWIIDTLGWSVEVRDDSNLSADTDIANFDVIIGWRLDDTLTLGDDLRSKAESAGIPYALFGMGSVISEGTAKTPGPEEADLTGTWEYVDPTPGVTKIDLVDVTHYITSEFSTGLLTVASSVGSSAAVDDGESTVGDVLAEADDSHANYVSGQAALIAIETGTDDLATTPVATTERALVWGFPYEFDSLTTDGATLMERAFTWLLSDRPKRPTVVVSATGTNTASFSSSIFEHTDTNRIHTATRWQVTLQTDTSWASPVWDSGYGTDLLAHTTGSVLSADEDYMVRIQHEDDLSQISEWSAEVDFTTDDYTTAAAGYMLEFYTSGDALISSIEVVTEATTYTELIEEGIEIPATTSHMLVTPIKRGGTSGGAAVKEVSVDRGSLSRGFAPYPFRPEVHTNELISATHNTTGASSSNALTIDWSEGRHQTHTLTENVTYTFTNMENGTYYLRTIQDSTARTVTWPGAVQWAGGTAGTVSTGNGNEDVWRFTMYDDTDIIGEEVAKNVS